MRSLNRIFPSFIVLMMLFFAAMYLISYHLYNNKINKEFVEKCRAESQEIVELLPLSLHDIEPETFIAKLQAQLERRNIISIALFDREMKLMLARDKKGTDIKEVDPRWMESLNEPRILEQALSVVVIIKSQRVDDFGPEAVAYMHIMFDLNDLYTSKEVFKSIILMAGIAGVIFFILFLIFLKRFIITPVLNLSEKAKQVSEGNLSVRSGSFFIKELKRLSETFNKMLSTLEEDKEMLKRLATTDGLTGLYNRKSFDETLLNRLAESVRYDHPFSLLFVDLDDFKSINDKYGHQGGDEVLISLANCFRQVLRKTDYPARIGGDEFAIIFSHTKKAESVEVAERIKRTINENPVITGGSEIRYTVTMGISSFPEDGITETDLRKMADVRLYMAKSKGKNFIIAGI